MASAPSDDPCPDALRPAIEHARAWLLGRVGALVDAERGIDPTLLPEVARFIAVTSVTLRDYEQLVERLRL